MHELLDHQLRKHFGSLAAVPAELRPLLAAVDEAYRSASPERGRAEAAPGTREDRFAQAFRASPVPSAITRERDGVFLDVNEAFCRMHGYARGELVGRSALDLDLWDNRRLRGQYLADLQAEGEVRDREIRYRTKAGEAREALTSVQRMVLGDEPCLLAIAVDITDRKRAQAALEESEARYRRLVETADEGILVLDPAGRITYVNHKMVALLGAVPEGLLGRPVFDFLAPAEVTRVREWLARRGDAEPERMDLCFRRQDGAEVWAIVSAAPVHGPGGEHQGVLAMVTDITARKRAEQRLQQAYEQLKELDAFRTQFINTAAHQLGTPLTPIKVQLHLLKQRFRDGRAPEEAKRVAMLERNVERLAQLVQDVLDAARLQAANLALKPAAVDLRALLAEGVEGLQGAARERGLRLELRHGPPLVVYADARRVAQVMSSLLDNALKFTPAGGRVEVEAGVRGRDAEVRVADTGLGIPTELQGRLFQPFSQVHDTGRTRHSGTGLGLFIARGIVESSGGRIWCESPGPGRGSAFLFTLPLATPEGGEPRQVREARDAREAPGPRARGRRLT